MLKTPSHVQGSITLSHGPKSQIFKETGLTSRRQLAGLEVAVDDARRVEPPQPPAAIEREPPDVVAREVLVRGHDFF